MTKAEMHYLNCQDDNCEFFFCVARRDYERQISTLQEEMETLNFYISATERTHE